MSFVSPLMLWGAAAAAIPIALHLFFRTRYRVVPWAAMRFLLPGVETTRRRLRFQEPLLLLVRVAVLVFLALALARPRTTSGDAGGGDAVAAVFLIDTSFSMGVHDGEATRSQRARTAALRVLEQLPAHSTVTVITCSDRAQVLGTRSCADLDRTRTIIAGVEVSHLASDLLPGLEEASTVMQEGDAQNKEFFLFSDMHKLGWERQGDAVVQAFRNIQESAAIHLIRCGGPRCRNAAVVGITPLTGVPRPQSRAGFAVLVRNSGTQPLYDLRISLSVEGSTRPKETRALPALAAKETRAVVLPMWIDKPGLHVLTASVGPDELDIDNRFDQVIMVRDRVNVLVIDGKPSEREPAQAGAFFLEHALVPVDEPAEYHVQVQRLSPRLASPEALARADVCILVDVALEVNLERPAEVLPADFLAELVRFVRSGHGLLVFAGDNVKPASYNEVLGKQHQLLPAKIKGVSEFASPHAPLHVNRRTFGLPAFLNFKEDRNYQGFGRFSIFRTLDLEDPAAGLGKMELHPRDQGGVVLRYSNEQPMMTVRTVGHGEVLLVATAASPGTKPGDPNPTWNDWPMQDEYLYLPFMNVAVMHLIHRLGGHNLTAGQAFGYVDRLPSGRLSEDGPDGGKGAGLYTLVHPDGRAERLDPPQNTDDGRVLVGPALLKAGIYHLQTPRAEPRGAPPTPSLPFAVVPDLQETKDLEALSDEQLDERLGFKVIHATPDRGAGALSSAERSNREWTLWFLGLVLGFVMIESVLAWSCDRGS